MAFVHSNYAQDSNLNLKGSYDTAFYRLRKMVNNQDYNFKQAVFEVENAYYNQQLIYNDFESVIQTLSQCCKMWIDANHQNKYSYPDSINVLKNYSIFMVIKDTIFFSKNRYKAPYSYDFEDFFGRNDWTKMFVTKLLASNSGNCHSLPYLYKILADEIDAKCWLSLAPNHIYIKNRCKKIGWYNTELTSSQFPIDAWIKASGYISLDAIRNGIYMDTLSNKQNIVLCMYDLAMGYYKQTGNIEDGFIIQCCDLALQHYPNHIGTLLLKAQILKKQFESIMSNNNAKIPSDVFHISKAKDIYDEMETLYVSIAKAGYYEMPEEMYLNWLASIKSYQNNLTIME